MPGGGRGLGPDRRSHESDGARTAGSSGGCPTGSWTILRFGRRNNGAVTRPAPLPGLGFECDKFDAAAFDAHFERPDTSGSSLEQGRGPKPADMPASAVDPTPHRQLGDGRPELVARFPGTNSGSGAATIRSPICPPTSGRIVGSLEQSERFLWDVRQTSNELIIENHAGRFKELGRTTGFDLSIEPYDMNPAADLDLGAVADIPMGEFWSDGFGFNSAFSCIEAASIAHVLGRPSWPPRRSRPTAAEAWKLYPGALKNQGDWAFAMGINRFVYHTFAHKSFVDGLRPGMTMGPYGVHWDRGQTWWPMAGAYHRYISRCQFLLSQGRTVADILYLAPEGAPHVFRPPASALDGHGRPPGQTGIRLRRLLPLGSARARPGRGTAGSSFPAGHPTGSWSCRPSRP